MATINISNYRSTQSKRKQKVIASLNISEILNREIRFKKARIGNKKKVVIYENLHILLKSGVDIQNALEIIKDNFSKIKDKEIVENIKHQIVNGQTISTAFHNTGLFSFYEYYSLRIGEETGKIICVLGDLHKYFKKKVEQRQKIIGAVTYPIIVILTAIIAVFFMMSFIVPMFENIYERFNRELPYLTSTVIDISHFFENNALNLLGIVLLLAILYTVFRNKPRFIRAKDHSFSKIPVIGDLIRKTHLINFCTSMELLISARIPLSEALSLTSDMINYHPISYSLSIIEEDLLKGSSLTVSMNKFPVFDKRILSLVKVGEEVNQLDKSFGTLKEQYLTEVDNKIAMLSSIIEPLLIIFIGSFVALILVSMYLPIFQMSTSFGF